MVLGPEAKKKSKHCEQSFCRQQQHKRKVGTKGNDKKRNEVLMIRNLYKQKKY